MIHLRVLCCVVGVRAFSATLLRNWIPLHKLVVITIDRTMSSYDEVLQLLKNQSLEVELLKSTISSFQTIQIDKNNDFKLAINEAWVRITIHHHQQFDQIISNKAKV